MKSALGEGYTVNVSFVPEVKEKSARTAEGELLDQIHSIAPLAYTSSPAPNEVSYHLKLKESSIVRRVLELVEASRERHGIANYSVVGTSIEDIFLGLMHDSSRPADADKDKELEKADSFATPSLVHSPPSAPVLQLTNGRRRSPLGQALTIFHKRMLIARRSWLTPTLAVLVAVAGSCIPIFFLSNRTNQSCVTRFRTVPQTPLYLPASPLLLAAEMATGSPILESPPGIIQTLGGATSFLTTQSIPDNATFVRTIDQNFRNLSFGGVSVDQQSGQALFAWEASPPGLTGLVALNLVSNLLYNTALNETGRAAAVPSVILANYQMFPGIAAGTLVALKWVAFFGAAMVSGSLCVHPWVKVNSFKYCRPSIRRFSRCMSRRSVARRFRLCSCQMDCRTPWDCGLGTCSSIPCLPSLSPRSSLLFLLRSQTSSTVLVSS